MGWPAYWIWNLFTIKTLLERAGLRTVRRASALFSLKLGVYNPKEVGEVADALAKFGADPIIRF